MSNFGQLSECDETILKEIFALCKSLQMVSYCMLIEHEKAYQTIDRTYCCKISYQDFMTNGIII